MTDELSPKDQALRDVKQIYDNMTTLFRAAECPLGDILLATTDFYGGTDNIYVVGRFRFLGKERYHDLIIEMPASSFFELGYERYIGINGGRATFKDAIPFIREWYEKQRTQEHTP
jgi:hypothetical protein